MLFIYLFIFEVEKETNQKLQRGGCNKAPLMVERFYLVEE